MKNIIKSVKLFLVAIQWFFGVVTKKLAIRNTWSYVVPDPPQKEKFFKSTAANARLAMRVNGSAFYDYYITLVNFVWKRTKYGYFMMMALPNPNQVVTAVLMMPRIHGDQVDLARQMITDSTGNAFVTVAAGLLATATSKTDDYANFHGAARDAAWQPMIEALEAIMNLFQIAANANKPLSIVIIQSGSFHVHGVGGRSAQVFEAFNSLISGDIYLTAPVNDKCCYEWWSSVDGITYTRLQGSTVAHTTITGLTAEKNMWFKCQQIVGNSGLGLSQAFKIMVK